MKVLAITVILAAFALTTNASSRGPQNHWRRGKGACAEDALNHCASSQWKTDLAECLLREEASLSEACRKLALRKLKQKENRALLKPAPRVGTPDPR